MFSDEIKRTSLCMHVACVISSWMRADRVLLKKKLFLYYSDFPSNLYTLYLDISGLSKQPDLIALLRCSSFSKMMCVERPLSQV